MRRHLRLFLFVVVFACFAVPAGAEALPSVSPRIFVLENGLSVLVREDDRFPLVSVRLYVKAGSAWERPEESGISHFLEHMVFRGSATREKGVDRMVENAGGYLNAYTSFDNTVYLTDLPADRWKTAVEAVRDLAFDPLLRPDDVDAEREVVLAEMQQRGDSPYTVLYHAMMGTALKGTPYERPVIGTREALLAATPESIRAYIRRRYDPRDMVLVAAGRVNAEEVLAEAEKLLGSYRNLNPPQVTEAAGPEDLTRGLRVVLREGPWNKAYVSVSFPVPAAGHPRNPAVDVLARLLGGDDSALLPRVLRIDKALADDVSAHAMNMERAGLFTVMAQLDPSGLDAFLIELTNMLKDFRIEDFSDEELDRAKLNLEDNFWRGQETVAQIADMAGNLYFFDPGDPDGLKYLSGISDVSRDQLRAVREAWLRPEAMTLTVVAPAALPGPESPELPEPGEARARPGETREERLAALVGGIWPAGGEALAGKEERAPRMGGPEIMDLGQGRTLALWADRSLPYVSATLTFPGGDIFVPETKQGLATLAASLLASATRDRDHKAMNAYLLDRASGLGGSARLIDFSLNLDAPRKFSGDIFALFREVMLRPAFHQEDFDRVKREQAALIASLEEDVSGVFRRELQPFLFGNSIYGHRIEGSLESLEGLTRQDVLDFWERQKVQPWVLSIVGDFTRDEALAFAESLPLPAAERVALPESPWAGNRDLSLKLPGRQQAAYALIFPTVPVSGRDSAAVSLLSASLSGFGGLLYQELREKRSLGYSVGPINWPGEKAGFLAFYIIAAPDKLDEARDNFLRIAADLHSGLLPVETVDRARAMLEAEYYQGLQMRAGRASGASRHILYGRPVDFTRLRLEEMRAMTPEILRETARKYLIPERAYSLRVAP